MLIEWTDNWSVGIRSIDEQHKKLVSYLNELHDAMLEAKGQDVIGQIVAKLTTYTMEHFALEEELFAKHAYADSVRHTTEHQAFIDRVEQFRKEVAEKRITVTIEVMSFLQNWLFNHIRKSDKAYSAFLISCGVI